MNIYTNTKFTGHYPVGVSAVVVADNQFEAAELLNAKLKECGLKPTATADQFVALPTENKIAIVLNDGDY